MPFDHEPFLHHLGDFDLTEAQKAELIHNVAAIMESFVDQAFGVHPVQQSMAVQANGDSAERPEPIDWERYSTANDFERAASDTTQREE